MSLAGGHLDALLAAGATAEQIVALVKADMVEREKAQEARREKDAERQRRKRHAESRGVTRTTEDNSDGPSPLNSPPKKAPDPKNTPPLISPQPEELSAEPTPAPLSKTEVIDAWQERMVPQGFPAIRKMTGQRERLLRARLKDSTLDEWLQAMAALERSAFCKGENDRGWRADFDFLLQPKSFTGLLEGKYDH